MFDADRPILKSDQDRLNRSIFAKYLARCMLDHKDPQSLVVGLYGGWGVGKTSVINMVVEELNFASTNLLDEEKPIILNFSPWSYSGQNQLIFNFFRRLSSVLRSSPYLENSYRIIQLLELYVSYFTQKPVPKPLRKKRTWSEVLTFKHNDEDIYAWESGRDLTSIKAELNELLNNQKHKIIIIIDNISRIYDYEMKQIFQIVKSMGDYVNTAYLLSFDKEIVVNAINRLDGSGGEEYVEKIVQLPFDIPPILQQDIEKIFADRLNSIVETTPEDTWNVEYWADIYYSSLKYFFQNCRDVTRYVNTLNFSYSRLRDVVNPVDFFALTAIEVFTPDIYFGIRENKDLFTDLLDKVYVFNEEQRQKGKMRCEEILSRTTRVSREILLALFMRLFPRIRRIYYPDESFHYSDAVAQEMRHISSPDVFDIYFRLSMQVGQIPESEFESIIKMASSSEAFDQALIRLNQDGRIITFLDMLDSNALEKITNKNVQSIISALLDNGDLFPAGQSNALSLDTAMRIHRITHRLLHSFKSTEERFEILQHAISKANKSLYILVHELKEQEREHSSETDTFLPHEFRDLTMEQLHTLQKVTVTRIEYWAKNGSLQDHPKLLPILFAWLRWDNAEKCRDYVLDLTKKDKGLVAFLTAALEKPISQAMNEYKKLPTWDKYLDEINVFIPSQNLIEHAKIIFENDYFEKLREKEQLAIMIFLDLTKANTQKVIPKTTAD